MRNGLFVIAIAVGALVLGGVGVVLIVHDQQDRQARRDAAAKVTTLPAVPVATDAPGGQSSATPKPIAARPGRAVKAPSPSSIGVIGGRTVTVRGRRGADALRVKVPRSIPSLASISTVVTGTTAASTETASGGSIVSVYAVHGDRCPTSRKALASGGSVSTADLVSGNAFEPGAFEYGNLAIVNVDPGPAVVCAYIARDERPNDLIATGHITIAAYRSGMPDATEHVFPSGTYIATGSDVTGGAPRAVVEVRIGRAKSPYGRQELTYAATGVLASGVRLRSCPGYTSAKPRTAQVDLAKTAKTLPPLFVGQRVTAHYDGPTEGDLVGGFAADGRLHATVNASSSTESCGGSIAFSASLRR